MPKSRIDELSAPMMRYFRPASSESGLVAEITDEDVEADRHGLERDEEHDEVVRLREQHHRRGDDEHEVVELDARHALLREADGAEQADEDRREQEKEPQELPVGGEPQQAVEGQAGAGGVEIQREANDDRELADDGGTPGSPGAAWAEARVRARAAAARAVQAGARARWPTIGSRPAACWRS